MAAYLEAIFKTAIDAIFTIDERGIVEQMNPAAEQLFGYDASEVLGNNISMLMPNPYRHQHDGYLNRYIETRQPRIIGIGREVIGLRKDGTEMPLRLAVSETMLDDRRVFTGILHDLSAMKEAEAEIRKLNEDLESQNDRLELKVNQRTEELSEAVNRLLSVNQQLVREAEERRAAEAALRKSEEELRNALKKEKQLNELKSRFVSMASHEFRTPLSTVLSSADLAEAYTGGEEHQQKRSRHLQRIKTAVGTLTSILNDFLSLSKLEENMVQTQAVNFKLKAFCDEVEDEMQGLLKPGQHIIQEHENCNAKVFLDKQILKNIIYNLISNASKYSNQGKPIFCRLRVIDEVLYIEVEDQGIGIPEEDQPYMFQRFFRANNVENIQGTGLGLNIVKRYLNLLGGDISFSSKPSHGSVFSVNIPLNKSKIE
ncbi:MAG: PAS domain-containing sensor histidine kinase [Saprospiraceae bacterium]|nr:PAS domain-containing sensor histidine kinase [Saprospiraceae bacterium]MCF8251991.1 PAS domain-containing sensor histidine kinase [Saprospiraceae bacterium]MCF8313662.1 PAS domain-containing sensor histidine kinase [Saprospiraceae bacterium]MCF8442369.1 PAS domain-containing sensor histidine kinase [Saprospiraceae bacterium]